MEIETTKTRIMLPDGIEESEFRVMIEEAKDEAVAEMCENVCRYSRMYKHREYGKLKREHCDKCPLNKI